MEKIDNNTTAILRFIYKHDSIVVQEIIDNFKLFKNSNIQYITSLLLQLISEGYLGLIIDDKHFVLKYNLAAHLEQCDARDIAPILPTQSVYLLPSGRALVEIARRNRWYFFAPLAASAISVLISLVTLLYELLDKSPTLVKLVLK